jgi:hypothetical protein
VRVTIKAPSYKGLDTPFVDTATGQNGIQTTMFSGQTSTKIVNLRVR